MTAFTDALLEAAVKAFESGALDQAESLLRMVIGRSGRDVQALYVLGHLSHVSGRLDNAAWFLSRALDIDPAHARAHNDLGETLRVLGRPEAAIPHLERAIALEPTLPQPYGTLATALMALDRPDEALRFAREALRRTGGQAAVHAQVAGILVRLGRPGEAIHHYDQALAPHPDDPSLLYARALARLSLGQMPEAWIDHEARLDLPEPPAGTRRFSRPRWTGQQPLAGKTILLHAEQGLGDTIQFIRYVKLFAPLGAAVLVEVQPGLKDLCATIDGAAAVFQTGDTLPDFDFHCSLMSLPAAFRTGPRDIPAHVPYLKANPAPLGPWRRMRVGVAWSGSHAHPADAIRSMPLERMAPLLNRPDIECHVIQRDIREADRAAMRDFPALIDHSADLVDFTRTAALIAAMDLVISVDTVVLHLAGALNMSTWAMLAQPADWRWQHDLDNAPWYPSMRLFRQKYRTDWASVLEQIGANLDQWAIPRG